MPEHKQQLDIHDLVDLDIEESDLPQSKLESPPMFLTNDNPLESQIQANNSFVPDLTLEDVEGERENSFQTSDNQTLIGTLFKFTSKNKNANDAVKKLQRILEFEGQKQNKLAIIYNNREMMLKQELGNQH